ncbi:MAG: Fe-S-containing hydro-lyase [Candidatus Krumholzibacteriota bacterium]|nr:Fe-S-containing hydro-lyase [Candidatus Krumholzibacteriota bacterium]
MAEYSLKTPLKDEDIKKLKAGDKVSLTGTVYTARDAAHARLVALLDDGKELPIPLEGQVIYYVGPSPTPPGKAIGSAGPTTSYRMDPYAPALLDNGLKGMIGKGARNDAVVDSMKKNVAVYFAATGGAAALISRSITSAEVVAYEDLGAEAVRKLTVKDFPLIVAQDCQGGNVYEEGQKKYRKE